MILTSITYTFPPVTRIFLEELVTRTVVISLTVNTLLHAVAGWLTFIDICKERVITWFKRQPAS